jgi:hypothetical protein
MLMMEAVRASGTLVYSETTWCYILEDPKLPSSQHMNMKDSEVTIEKCYKG